MVDLNALWRSRLKLVVENLVEGEREHREIASLAEQIEADYHGRFLVELIQNANDQAVAAGIEDASILIVRTENVLAILNQGRPFDDEGVRDITSIGLSSKSPDVCLGNKGIGFKAVFEITQSPEIYSAPHPASSFTDCEGTRFRLDTNPLSRSTHQERAREMVTDILADRESDLTPGEVLEEAAEAAPFKYPLEVAQGKLEERLSTLSIPPDTASRFQTLVYLPLIEDGGAAVERALSTLVDKRGAAVLFLNGVGNIQIRDRSRSISYALGCRQIGSTETIGKGGRLQKVLTWRKRGADGIDAGETENSPREDRMIWWKVSREIGTRAGGNAEREHRERGALQEAAKDLPGEAWKNLVTAPVAVALPRGRPDSSTGEPLGADGLFCIGLPTEMPTGTPVWLHSHFHGNISRTEIDLETQRYNALLFKEGLRLLRCLLEHLRNAPDLEDRRLVTLAMEPSSGPIKEALHEGRSNIRGEKIILSADRKSYIRPIELTLPPADDVAMLQWLLPPGEEATDYGFVLPEEKLLANSRTLLEELTKRRNPGEESRSLFLEHRKSGKSLIERGAENHRHDGPSFWVPFLRWLHNRFPADDLTGQRILPVGSFHLRAPEDRVFFAPSPQRGGPDLFEDLDAEASLTDLPFVDERAVPVREDDGRYTELATKLAPETGAQLVRRPEALDLINDAIAPYMAEALSDPCDSGAALTGLRLALLLTDQISEARQERVHRQDLRVPIGDPSSPKNWIPSTEAYFGTGWLDDETDELLREAYGGDGRRLISWPHFQSLIDGSEDRKAWTRRLEALGVDAAPKVVKPGGNRPAPLESHSKQQLRRVESGPPPLSGLDVIWSDYLEHIRQRPARTSSGQAFDVDEVVWVDGLEDPERRSAVVRLMLLHARKYRDETETTLGRVKNVRNRDRTSVPTMWTHALRTSDWSVIPTTQGLVPPSEAWLVPGPSRTRSDSSFRILPVVSDRYSSADADAFLKKIGVSSLGEAGAGELVRALHQIARELPDLSADDRRAAEVVTKDLYRDIQARLGGEGESSQLDHVIDHPVPLSLQEIEAVDLKEIDVLYLNDDPIRGRFVPGLERAPKIPTRAGRTYGRLLEELRRVLGNEHVQRTSTAEVETGFEPFDEPEPALLRKELEDLSPNRNVQLDLAVIVACLGATPLDPRVETFRQLWDEFDQTRIQRGRFPPDAGDIDAFYDRQGRDRPILQLHGDAKPSDILQATWQLFGEGYRDVIELYAGKISQNEGIRKFFRKRGVGEEEFRRLRKIIEGAAEAELDRAKALGLVLVRRRSPGLSVRSFNSQWNVSRQSDGEPLVDEASIESLRAFGRAIQRGDERRISEILSDAGVSVEEWQSARQELGSNPWRFQTTAELFEDVREGIEAEMMALAARRPSVDPDRCRNLVESLREIEPPSDFLLAPGSRRQCRVAVLTAALSCTDEDGLISRRLREELETGDSFIPNDVPDREVSDYRQTSQRMRTRRAEELLSDILDVAEAVAESLDESLKRSEISDDPRIRLLSQGWLASHFALAPALRDRLADQVPRTADALMEAGAFRDRVPKSELWRAFPDAKPEDRGRSELRSNFEVFGESWQEDEIKKDLAAASQGSIGAEMRDRASGEIDLRRIAIRERESVSPTSAGSGASGSSESGTTSPLNERSETRRARELNGLLGEVFAFEQLRQRLPGFDSTCWVSENRTYYGHEDPGSDAEGHDFFYIDPEGLLTPNKGAACEIEVKSSSSAEPVEFNLTQNEMNRARACHQDKNREYVVIWVANVRDDPTLRDILVDPIDLWEQGLVDITAKGGRTVRVPDPKVNREEE